MNKIILLFLMTTFFLGLYAQENNETVEYNYCSYINGAKLVSIDMNTSISNLEKEKNIYEKYRKKFDTFYYKIELNNNVLTKVLKYTLVTNKLIEEYFFNKNEFLEKKIIYKNAKEKNICNITYTLSEKKAIEKCSKGEKTISFYHSFNGDIYKKVFYKDKKYLGKTTLLWKEGTMMSYNSKDELIFKSDEMSHFIDTCGTLIMR
jgi:hypothetical protein